MIAEWIEVKVMVSSFIIPAGSTTVWITSNSVRVSDLMKLIEWIDWQAIGLRRSSWKCWQTTRKTQCWCGTMPRDPSYSTSSLSSRRRTSGLLHAISPGLFTFLDAIVDLIGNPRMILSAFKGNSRGSRFYGCFSSIVSFASFEDLIAILLVLYSGSMFQRFFTTFHTLGLSMLVKMLGASWESEIWFFCGSWRIVSFD